jgi:hypothetical protein
MHEQTQGREKTTSLCLREWGAHLCVEIHEELVGMGADGYLDQFT